MFQYNSAKEMKCFLDKNIDCKTKEGKDLLEQIKHYLDWPLQLYALQEAEYLLQVELGGEFDDLTIPKKIISRLAEDLYEKDFLADANKCVEFTTEFLKKTPLEEEYSPFHPDNVTYECAYSNHNHHPTFDIRFINVDGCEDETEFTCEANQNIVQCLRELHHLFEDFKKENPGIKEALKVMYVGTDTSYVSEEGKE